uniref:NADH dehydrogenase subunit 5 n=1 Tax=Camallanus lacustris TaxID=378086 RepID=UPI0022FD844F|nr:NADH dehydrogenase subunit 5 [Camallanus lacustris]WAX01721.1 NADH dehydrogenase subunit 5 [Camallanus lacustris]
MDMFIFVLLFMILFFFFLFFMVGNFGFSLSFLGLDLLDLSFHVDWVVLFLVFYFFIVGCILLYSCYYMSLDFFFSYYVVVLMVFVFSMVGVVFSNNCLVMIISWDVLGVSSYFLVLYYGNWDSCSGSLNTVMLNRLGDVCVFLVFSGLFVLGESFIFVMVLGVSSLVFFFFGCMTKSAQIPFSSWLPKAMSAPTPVSALVHSSTLVTAGLFLAFCFSDIVFLDFFMVLLFFVGLLTMFISGFSACFECDLKKMVALSTLSQIGFCFFGLGLGLVFFSFIHILSHAIFKSCLFMQVGYLIHSFGGQQDGRGYGYVGSGFGLVWVQIYVCLMCLCGFFFLSGSVSKEMLLEFYFFNSWGLLVFLLFIFSVVFTFFYCYRIVISFFSNFFFSLFYGGMSWFFSFCSIILVVMSIFFVWWLVMNFMVVPLSFLYFDFFSFFFFVILFLCFFILCFFIFGFDDIKYKFFFDFLPKVFLCLNMNSRYLDSVLSKLIIDSYSGFFYFSGYFYSYFGGKGFNFVVVLFFLFLLL